MSKLITDLVNNVYNTELEEENYQFVSEFTFLWSVFESLFRKEFESLNLKRIETVFNKPQFKKLKENIGLPTFILIEKSEDDVVLSFPNIEFKVSLFPSKIQKDLDWFENKFKDISILENESSKKFLLMCFTIYRLRNNLFHGNKKFYELHQQKELFSIMNKFMAELIEKTFKIEI